MSDESDELEPIPVSAKAWNQRELLATIVSRHFAIKEELGGLWPTWVVYPIVEDEQESDVHETLEKLNEHLVQLDWMAELRVDDPWLIKIKPRPIRQFSMTKGAKIFFWVGALFSTLFVGAAWVSPQYENFVWHDTEMLTHVLLFYSIPFLCAIGFASYLQKRVADRLSMRVGGIVPIMMPFAYTPWPFGVISIPSVPRMDDIKWSDRQRLGLISFVAPATLIVSGFIFVMLGLFLTPENTELHAMPKRLGFSLLPQALGMYMLGEQNYILASSWVHPLALAGQGLMLLGWISLLPFPGMPGNRILISEVGLQATRSTGSQIILFLAICVTGLMFGAFTGHEFWTFLTILGALGVLINGADTSTPTILNDVKLFSESSSLSLSHIIFLTLLLALPAEFPTEDVQNWNEELEWDIPEISEVEINSTTNISISITSNSLITRSWSIQGWQNAVGWDLSWDCNGEIIEIDGICDGDLQPLQSTEVKLVVKSPATEIGVTGFMIQLWIEDEENGTIDNMQIVPKLPVVSSTQYWDWDGNHVSPRICTNLHVNSDAPLGNITLTDVDGNQMTLWSIENTSRFTLDPKETTGQIEICAVGVSGAIHLLDNYDQLSDKVVPTVNWIGDDGQSWSAAMSIEPTSPNLLSNGSMVVVDDTNEIFMSGQHLLLGVEGTLCDLNAAPRLPAGNNTTWSWDLTLREEGLLPTLEEGGINITLPESGWLHICGNNSIIPERSWPISPTSNNNLALTDWDGRYLDSWITNSTNSTENSWQLPVDDAMIRLHGDGLITPSIDGDNATVSLSSTDNGERVTVFWVEVEQDGRVLFNIASWSLEGSE